MSGCLRRREFIAALGAAAAWPLAGRAQQSGGPLDELIAMQMKDHLIPGLAVAVLQNGKVVKAQGYGYADIKRKKLATTKTVFQIASVTKQFVASGVMILVEGSKLSTDAPITEYLHNVPTAWNGVTVHHLLTHTSGIQDYQDSSAAAKTDLSRDPQLRGLVRTMALQFRPGEKWEYSNSNYVLLGEIIGQVSGKSWDRFLVDRLFHDLGMAATHRRVIDDPAMAIGYMVRTNGGSPREAPSLPSALWDNGDGGLVSTAEDMAKWDMALSAGIVVTQRSIDEMYRRTKLNSGKEVDYGYGMVVNVVGKHRIIGHGGGRPGVAANFTRWLDDGISVAVLANAKTDPNQAYQIARSIAKLYVPDIP